MATIRRQVTGKSLACWFLHFGLFEYDSKHKSCTAATQQTQGAELVFFNWYGKHTLHIQTTDPVTFLVDYFQLRHRFPQKNRKSLSRRNHDHQKQNSCRLKPIRLQRKKQKSSWNHSTMACTKPVQIMNRALPCSSRPMLVFNYIQNMFDFTSRFSSAVFLIRI